MSESKPDPSTGAKPFSQIFVGRSEADWALDLLRETTRRLQVTDPYDPRVALTLSKKSRKPVLRLNFGSWLVLGFRGPGPDPIRVEMALLADQVSWDERFSSFSFDRKKGEPEVRCYQLPLDFVRPLNTDLKRAYETTLDHIAGKFASWKRSPHWKQHNPEIIEALFDPDQREQILAGMMAEPELRYERHLTVFHHELAEEDAAYRSQTGSGQRNAVQNPEISLVRVADETGFDQADLTRWVRAVERKGQVIVYGPPGTGKTYLAEWLARHLVGGADGFWELVQFHPAYAYEDFVQGIRPQSEAGSLSYQMTPGRFLQFCAAARQRTGKCVLIIDEINRAELARVLGELMYLLEYRQRGIPLAGGGTFMIPANVRVIGTMNTADRSIALVDHALRRRFAFVALRPDYEVLRRYHRQTGIPVDGLVEVLTRLNRQIDADFQVGITYFLRPQLAEEIEDIWQMEIEPYLEEYFFAQPDKVEAFRWAVIAAEVRPS